MGGSARKGDLMGMPWDAPPSMADTDVATVLTKAEALFVSLLLPAGRKGAAGEDNGPARSQGWDSGVAQQSPPMVAISAAMPTIAAKVMTAGCLYLDAPVSGGEVGAKAGSLTIMVGGTKTAFERARPLFELMGQNITLVGDNGAGLGASHQTGWTGLVAKLIQQSGGGQ